MAELAAYESRAQVRRAFALTADGERAALAPAVIATAFGESPEAAGSEAVELVMSYVLDARAGAMLATSPARSLWLGGPLFDWIGPGNAAPVHDQIAALLAGPLFTVRAGEARGTALSPLLLRHRFAPRADDAVAAAVGALEPAARLAALAALAADRGPDPDRLALSLVQCGRVIAWTPTLADETIGAQIVDQLIALLEPSRPQPLLELVAHALAPIARHGGPLAARIRDAALAGLAAAARPLPTSFAEQVAAIGRSRAMPDEDRMRGLPRREVADACAYILGFAAPVDRVQFAAYRALVLAGDDADSRFAPFIDGLVAAAHVPALTELVAGLLDGDDDDDAATALGLAGLVPLDELGAALRVTLEHDDPGRRAGAIEAVTLLDDPEVDGALAARLGDQVPQVAAAAARALVLRGQHGAIAAHAARETHALRAAIARTSTGELAVSVIGELVTAALDDLSPDTVPGDSPLRAVLGDALLRSTDGLALAATLITEIPAAASVLALASAVDADRDVGILAPTEARTPLAEAARALAAAAAAPDGEDTDELAALALYLLARMSAGDPEVARDVTAALEVTRGSAGQLVAALGELRVADATTAAALGPLVGPDSALGARVLAAAVCGRALPAEDAAWPHVEELLELGTIARAAAWSALRDRARRR